MKHKEARKVDCWIRNLEKVEKHEQLKEAKYKGEVSVQ